MWTRKRAAAGQCLCTIESRVVQFGVRETITFLFSPPRNMLGYYLFVLVVYSILIPQSREWETPSPHQYHIQTDEGPERYFRYQTDSGQYRKEKRLQDGTVVGTYAWIDADGILRQRDYIADNAGYRILKNQNVYVGRNINVGEAVKSAKKYPADGGTLIKTGLQHTRPVITVPYQGHSYSSTFSPITTPSPIPPRYNYVSSTIAPPIVSSTYSPSVSYSTPASIPSSTFIPSTTASPTSNVSPYVHVTPNSIDSSTPFRIIIPTENDVVDITPNSYLRPVDKLNILGLNNLTYVSGNHLPSTAIPYTVSTETPYYERTTVTPNVYTPSYVPSDFGNSGEVDHNSLEYNPYVRQIQNSYRFQNGPTYPLDKNGHPFSGYEPKSQRYDGVSVTNDGFRYYIPRAYHEEETSPGDKRSGSFGYIDPFGIRRVIYYNTAPGTGFQHRKNNRYVGFNAPPYDPRPY